MSSSFRLGGSEFYRDDPSETHYWDPRVMFMQAVSKVAPSVLTNLRDRVLPVCNSLRGEQAFSERHIESWKSVSSSTTIHRPYLRPLKKSIVEFVSDHHLDCEWACEIVLCTVREWSRPVSKGVTTSSTPLDWAYPPASARFPFSSREELDWKLAKQQHTPIRRFLNVALGRGFRRSVRKHDYTHFRWLARFQILGWSHERIATEDKQKAGRKTVAEAIARTAALLPLKLRPTGRPGRPKTGN